MKQTRGLSPSIPNLVHNGSTLSTPSTKASALNTFFESTFTTENLSHLPKLRNHLKNSNTWSLNTLDDVFVTPQEVFEELCKLNPMKASGPDAIPGRLLKEGATSLADPLSTLFNLSLSTGQLPLDWRRANITPVFKNTLSKTIDPLVLPA